MLALAGSRLLPSVSRRHFVSTRREEVALKPIRRPVIIVVVAAVVVPVVVVDDVVVHVVDDAVAFIVFAVFTNFRIVSFRRALSGFRFRLEFPPRFRTRFRRGRHVTRSFLVPGFRAGRLPMTQLMTRRGLLRSGR